MTEYDYSPEGYRRYMEKQNSIRRWAEQTGRYEPANPFAPTTPAVRAMTLEGRGHRSDRDRRDRPTPSRSGSGRYETSSSRPTPSRSNSYATVGRHSRPTPTRSTTMPMPPPPPPQPPTPRRSNTYTGYHTTVFYTPAPPPPQLVHSPMSYHHQYFPPPQPQPKSILSKIGSFFSSSSTSSRPEEPGVVYIRKPSKHHRSGKRRDRRYSY